MNPIDRIDITAGIVSAAAGAYQSSGSTDGDASSARFSSPQKLQFDPSTDLMLIADGGNNKIRSMTVVQEPSGCACAAGFATENVEIYSNELIKLRDSDASLASVQQADVWFAQYGMETPEPSVHGFRWLPVATSNPTNANYVEGQWIGQARFNHIFRSSGYPGTTQTFCWSSLNPYPIE